jgi:hypothetical protein
MDKDFLRKVTNILKQNSYRYSLEGYITDGKYYVGEIFVYNCEDVSDIKKLLDRDILKHVKLSESYSWYLGDKRKTPLIKLKEEVELTIPDFEVMQTSNYAEGSLQTL